MTTFIEENCTIEHNGQQFTQNGAWLCDCTDGYRRGVVYVAGPNSGWPSDRHPTDCVTDWHDNIIAKAEYGPIYQGNFCRMKSVSFILDGIRYTGRWCPDWSQAVKV